MKHCFYAVSADGSCAVSALVGEILASPSVIGIAPIQWCKESVNGPGFIETDCDILARIIRSAAERAHVSLFV